MYRENSPHYLLSISQIQLILVCSTWIHYQLTTIVPPFDRQQFPLSSLFHCSWIRVLHAKDHSETLLVESEANFQANLIRLM